MVADLDPEDGTGPTLLDDRLVVPVGTGGPASLVAFGLPADPGTP